MLLIGFAFPFFSLLQNKDVPSVWAAIIPAICIVYALMYGQQATLFAAQFPAEVRYSGISLSVQVSGAIGGGLAPLVATSLMAVERGGTTYVSYYLIALGIIAFLCALTMRNKVHD